MHALVGAIQDFVERYGKDERYKGVLEHLQGASGAMKDMAPKYEPSPGDRAVTAAADPDSEKAPPVTRQVEDKPPADAPKSFADATAAAKERLSAA